MSLESAKPQTHFQYRLENMEIATGLTDREIKRLSRQEIYDRLENVIGKTTCRTIELPNNNVLIQKDESENPTESHYDRCYVHLLRELEKGGTIAPGDTLLETSSGSAGISFAWMCKKLGYKSVVFMPGFVPKPRIIETQNLGDEVYLSHDRESYLATCAAMMVDYLKTHRERIKQSGHKIWMPNHSQDLRTTEAFSNIVDEVHMQTGGKPIDYFIGAIGNGSTLLGIGKKVKAFYDVSDNKHCQVIGFEPASACPYYKKYSQKWGKVAPRLINKEDIPEGYSFHQLPGAGGFGNVDFPCMDIAITHGVVDDICAVPEERILPKVDYNEKLPQYKKQGNTSVIARFIAETMAEKVSNRLFLTLIYDKKDRYGLPQYV